MSVKPALGGVVVTHDSPRYEFCKKMNQDAPPTLTKRTSTRSSPLKKQLSLKLSDSMISQIHEFAAANNLELRRVYELAIDAVHGAPKLDYSDLSIKENTPADRISRSIATVISLDHFHRLKEVSERINRPQNHVINIGLRMCLGTERQDEALLEFLLPPLRISAENRVPYPVAGREEWNLPEVDANAWVLFDPLILLYAATSFDGINPVSVECHDLVRRAGRVSYTLKTVQDTLMNAPEPASQWRIIPMITRWGFLDLWRLLWDAVIGSSLVAENDDLVKLLKRRMAALLRSPMIILDASKPDLDEVLEKSNSRYLPEYLDVTLALNRATEAKQVVIATPTHIYDHIQGNRVSFRKPNDVKRPPNPIAVRPH